MLFMKPFKFFVFYIHIYIMYYYITNMEMVESNAYILLNSEQKSDSNNSAEV